MASLNSPCTRYGLRHAGRTALAQLLVMAFTLVLLRHAKSAYPYGVSDHERPLNARGQRDAPVAGALISAQCAVFDLALVSTATRAQQTWKLSGVAADRVVDAAQLYLASPEVMLRQVQDHDARRVIVVAHNPGTEDLAARLTSNTDSEAYRRMMMKFPTAAFARLESDLPFAQWQAGVAELVEFGVGRG